MYGIISSLRVKSYPHNDRAPAPPRVLINPNTPPLPPFSFPTLLPPPDWLIFAFHPLLHSEYNVPKASPEGYTNKHLSVNITTLHD